MSGYPIDVTNNPDVKVTKYVDTDRYNTTGDNSPFTTLENRDNFMSDLYQKCGMIMMGNTPTPGSFSSYDLVTLDDSGLMTAVAGSATTNIALTDVLGIVYPVEGTEPAYTKATDDYYYIVVSSQLLSIPRTEDYFITSTWDLPTEGSRLVTSTEVQVEIGDYVYYNVDSGTPSNNRFVLFPIEADLTGSYTPTSLITDSSASLRILKLGKVVAITDDEIIFNWEIQTYGTGRAGTNNHSALTDVTVESQTDPQTNPWTNEHYGYLPRILLVDSISGTPSIGDLIEVYDNAGVPTYRKSINDDDASLVGVYFFNGTGGTPSKHYIMTRGLWDTTAIGANIGGLGASVYSGQSLWDAGNAGAGTATLSKPAYDATSGKDNIKYLGAVVEDTGGAPYTVYIRPQNGINKAMDYALALYTNRLAPDPDKSNLQSVEGWGNVTQETGTFWNSLNYLTDIARMHSDASVHLAHIATDATGTPSEEWFALTENCFMNDLMWEQGENDGNLIDNYQTNQYTTSQAIDKTSSISVNITDYSATVTGTVLATTSTAHGFSTGDLLEISGTTNYNGKFFITVVDTLNFYVYATYVSDQSGTADYADDSFYRGPSVCGSYRTGRFSWQSCQDDNPNVGGGEHRGLDLSDYATITLTGTDLVFDVSSGSYVGNTSAIYWWKDTVVDDGISLRPQIPWVGLMFLVHDINGKEEACCFSYEGYTGWNTETFTFFNVNIVSRGSWVSNPNWDPANTSYGGWTTPIAGELDGWKLMPVPVGGLRLKLSGTGTFDKFRVTPPFASSFWHHLKKMGVSALGSDSTTSGLNDGGMIEGGGVDGWDMTDDAATGKFWEDLINDTGFESTYTFDYQPSNSYDQITFANIATGTLIGACHRSYPHPGMLPSAYTGTVTANSLTSLGNDEYELTVTGGTNPASGWTVYPDGVTEFMKGMRIDIQTTDVNGAYEVAGGFITGIDEDGATGTVKLRFKYHTTPVLSATFYWTLYNTLDDIVNSPSIVAVDDQELWVDISKKSFYRAYGLLLSVLDPGESDSLEITIAQSSLNDGVRCLKQMVAGTEVFRYMKEGQKLKTFVKPRLSAPSSIIYE